MPRKQYYRNAPPTSSSQGVEIPTSELFRKCLYIKDVSFLLRRITFFSKMLMQPPAFFNTGPWASVGPFLVAPGHQNQEAELAGLVMQIVLCPTSGGATYLRASGFWEVPIQCLGEAVPFSSFFKMT